MKKRKNKKERFPLPAGIQQIAPVCSMAPVCNGCNFQTITYEDELEHKKHMILSSLEKIDGFSAFKDTFEGVKGATETLEYRNKLEFTFGDDGKDGNLQLGLRKKGYYYEILDGTTCLLGDEDFRKLMITTVDFFRKTDFFFHPFRALGALKYLLIRKGFFTGEILINLVSSDGIKGDLLAWQSCLLALPLQGKIVGILHTIDNKTSGSVNPESMEILYGNDFYDENILDLRFKISPFSFFQTNTKEAENLYRTVKTYITSLLKVDEKPLIFDLYCGTGTIAQILAPLASSVYGIDIVEASITMARENATRNKIKNCTFIHGDVTKTLHELPENPDIIIVDPPREGLNPKLLGPLIALNPKAICYVSCNPHTLAIDLPTILKAGYGVNRFMGHDLFPQTKHVETVVLLTKK